MFLKTIKVTVNVQVLNMNAHKVLGVRLISAIVKHYKKRPIVHANAK